MYCLWNAGVAIYVFFIVDLSDNTDVIFYLDGEPVDDFQADVSANVETYSYNRLVFSRTGLPNSAHTCKFQRGRLVGFDPNTTLFALFFDYVIYT